MLKLVKAPHGFLTYCDLFRWHFATLTNPALPLPDTAQVTMGCLKMAMAIKKKKFCLARVIFSKDRRLAPVLLAHTELEMARHVTRRKVYRLREMGRFDKKAQPVFSSAA